MPRKRLISGMTARSTRGGAILQHRGTSSSSSSRGSNPGNLYYDELRSRNPHPQLALRATERALVPSPRPPARAAERPAARARLRPRDQPDPWDVACDHTLERLAEYERAYGLKLVNLIRVRLAQWQTDGRPGATRVTRELIEWWRRDGRQQRLFFASSRRREMLIFLREARAQTTCRRHRHPPRRSGRRVVGARDYDGFLRYACKMATRGAQDDGHGDDRRLEHPQQRCRTAPTRPIPTSSSSSAPTSRSATGSELDPGANDALTVRVTSFHRTSCRCSRAAES